MGPWVVPTDRVRTPMELQAGRSREQHPWVLSTPPAAPTALCPRSSWGCRLQRGQRGGDALWGLPARPSSPTASGCVSGDSMTSQAPEQLGAGGSLLLP